MLFEAQVSLNRALGSNKFGPAIAPMVVDHTTIERSRPRVSSLATSVAAKRAWRLTADMDPRNKNAKSTTGNKPNCAPRIASSAPTQPSNMPVLSEVRRSYVETMRARGIEKIAAPIVVNVAADPPHEAPAKCAASKLPIDSVTPLDAPTMIWAKIRPLRTRVR